MDEIVICPLRPPPWPRIEPLVRESEDEGFRFLTRLRDEYQAGTNRFDGPGEVLLGVFSDGELVALGGVNVDPYAADPRVGRIRHVYVARARRRGGAGRRLVEALVEAARPHFNVLTLRTDTEAAARFYEALGFERVDGEAAHSHRRVLRG